ncbi:MAG: NirD/YgiW/YdeI family stress tolerance protein [Acinetobacter sp.]|uniref:NirD/YgiW/YdeI family stress tolerance protein n=1 Tax=Acinetobacter sp. TaxID=472 RepID=UPI003982C03C
MNKMCMTLCLTGSLLATTSVWAGKDDHVILAEAAQKVVTVAEAKKLPDATAVTLTGTLLKHLNQEHYEFNDGTGLILLEIDDDLWKAAGLKAGDKVTAIGEVDTHRYKPTDIEVVKIEKVTE